MPEQEDLQHLTYQASGVNYNILDKLKRLAAQAAAPTMESLRRTPFSEVLGTRGESGNIIEHPLFYLVSTTEGLGTKNLIADEMHRLTGESYYEAIAQDTIATIVNDVVAVGATPVTIEAFWAGGSKWFEDSKDPEALAVGWGKVCEQIGLAWIGGETQVLNDMVRDDTVILGGTVNGIVEPKERLVTGERLQAGDAILLVESNGIHTNGLTLARELAKHLPQGYLTKISEDGPTYGESLLQPSRIYAPLIRALLNAEIDLHYVAHITGHGFRKLMRANQELTYVIDHLPPVSSLFTFIQQHTQATNEEMYGTFNMGAGYAIFVPQDEVEKIIAVGQEQGLHIHRAGRVEKGPKQVIIEEKGIIFPEESLAIR